MKVVIDIPEAMYKDANILIVKDLPELKKIVANGIPYEERPHGKWKKIGEDYYNWCNHNVIKCKHCGYIKDTAYDHFPHFCEDCGADMRGDM